MVLGSGVSSVLGVSPAPVPAARAASTPVLGMGYLNWVTLSDRHPKILAVICRSPSAPWPGWDTLQMKLLFYLILLVLRAALTRADRFEIADLV